MAFLDCQQLFPTYWSIALVLSEFVQYICFIVSQACLNFVHVRNYIIAVFFYSGIYFFFSPIIERFLSVLTLVYSSLHVL